LGSSVTTQLAGGSSDVASTITSVGTISEVGCFCGQKTCSGHKILTVMYYAMDIITKSNLNNCDYIKHVNSIIKYYSHTDMMSRKVH
jgi:hypothetical protein